MSGTADHVFPREIFQLNQRVGLPKVPSCTECNSRKSKLEHYLLSVLPFGGTHANAHKALSVDVARRLQKNKKLYAKIRTESGYKFIPTKEGELEKRLALSLDYEILHEFIGFVGRGLIFHHWNKYLPLDCTYKVFTPSPTGLKFLDSLFSLSTPYRVNIQLGNDTVRYKGVLSGIDEGMSIWAIQLLGGITIADDMTRHIFSNSFVAMITGAEQMFDSMDFL
jgi:hypothetical protein